MSEATITSTPARRDKERGERGDGARVNEADGDAIEAMEVEED